MRLVVWMAADSVLSAAAAAALAAGAAREILLGMCGPLLVACVSWVVTERTWQRAPVRLTAVMMTAFAGKLVFFAAYVAFMLSVLPLRPVPFVASFTAYFIALHLAEAFSLRRLLATAPR